MTAKLPLVARYYINALRVPLNFLGGSGGDIGTPGRISTERFRKFAEDFREQFD